MNIDLVELREYISNHWEEENLRRTAKKKVVTGTQLIVADASEAEIYRSAIPYRFIASVRPKKARAKILKKTRNVSGVRDLLSKIAVRRSKKTVPVSCR